MNLFFLRHASAGTRRANPLIDVKRPLDRDGKQFCLRLGHVLSAHKVSFDLVISSPLKRSLQTASMLSTELGYEAAVQLSNGLAPSATFADFQKLLHEVEANENVLVVGHNPNLSSFLGQLLHAPVNGNGRPVASIRLRKGSFARVTVERGEGTLQYLLDPRLVRSLYSASTKSSRRKTARSKTSRK